MNDASGAKRLLTTSVCSRPSAQSAFGHARALRGCPWHQPFLRVATCQPGLCDADPGSASRNYFRDLPLLAGRSRRISRRLRQAHPGRRETGEPAAGIRVVSLTVPDLGNARRNQAIDALIAEYGRHVARLASLLKD